MPDVAGKPYPYTKKGKEDAAKAEAQLAKATANPMNPMSSPPKAAQEIIMDREYSNTNNKKGNMDRVVIVQTGDLPNRIERNNRLFDAALANETKGPFGGTVLGKLSNRAVKMFGGEQGSVIRHAIKAAKILEAQKKAK